MALSGQPNIALHVYPATVRVHALYVGLGLLYAVSLVLRRRLPFSTSVGWPLLALTVVYSAAAWWSIYPRLSLETVLATGGVVLAFYIFADRELVDFAWLVRGLVGLGLAASLFGIFR